MSYSAEISFKTIDGGKLFAFFCSLKEKVGEEMNAIAKANFLYAPSVRYCIKDKGEERKADREWAEKVFRWRWFYLEEHQLLGIYGVPDCAKSLFDATCYFQNSMYKKHIRKNMARKWMQKTLGTRKGLMKCRRTLVTSVVS